MKNNHTFDKHGVDRKLPSRVVVANTTHAIPGGDRKLPPLIGQNIDFTVRCEQRRG